MAAETNVKGVARLAYLVVGLGVAAWAIWGGGVDWEKWTALAIGAILCVLALIGYSPFHAMFGTKGEKTS